MKPSRLLLYHHYDRDDIVDDHILYQLQAFADLGMRTVFCSNNRLAGTETAKLAGIAQEVEIRDNDGFDFGAWRQLLLERGRTGLADYDELVLVNSTCYGPIFPLSEMFDAMAGADCEFWVPTRHGRTREFPMHGQPYLLVVRRKLLDSDAFWHFWETMPPLPDYAAARKFGELRLTAEWCAAGFRMASYVNVDDVRPMPYLGYQEPFILRAADYLIERYRLPLVKVKAFMTDAYRPAAPGGDIIRAMRRSGSDYPEQLMVNHMRRVAPLSWLKNLPATTGVIAPETAVGPDPGLKIGVIAHFFRPDIPPETLKGLGNIPYPFDLLVTTGSDALAAELRQRLADASPVLRRLEVRVAANRGRDAAPWLLAFEDVHLEYDLMLKLHVKAPAGLSDVFARAWNRHLIESMLASPGHVAEIVRWFTTEARLGVVLQHYPPGFVVSWPRVFEGTAGDREHFEWWLRRCGVNPPREADGVQPVFSAGAVFWYRPRALARLLTCGVRLEDFPPEPFPAHSTIGHGLERVIPYVAQGAGFYYKFAIGQDRLLADFQRYEDRLTSGYDNFRLRGVKRSGGIFLLAVARWCYEHNRWLTRHLDWIKRPLCRRLFENR